jgi:protein-S-isoprenylcysteine O-methyltransferase Ste14
MLIAFGFAAAAASWVILVAAGALFAAIYIPTIQSEEAYLRSILRGSTRMRARCRGCCRG